ncbi:structural maintenance of chromosomes protein 3-like [Daphnia carinata]|uniref:structural maintenance of chromosomes protein 3-like n=1 Tax=Daphnia carinata TaxID=120202 RepID=UPI00257AA172|nr:structural maintenance of chromosomes protein 3-like [Daphnia carinata]
MHIEKVIIEGFKTFRNKTVLCLKPGLNVIVGRNGAGKTNVMCAIRFVLSHEFHHLSQRERENFLHSSAGFRATSAYVEIIFNNEDRRLPEETKEVSLRREITSTKDVYLLNGRSILKHQVQNALQFAGFSKVNPYYIIKQGQINNLAMLSNEKRLALLSEITGAGLWKEIRPKDDSLLKDAEFKITELRELVKETEDDLTRLEKDERQYRKWSEINTKKRAVEATLARKEQAQLVECIAKAKMQLSNAQTEGQTASAEMAQKNENVAEVERRSKLYQSEFRAAQGRLKYLAEIAQDLALEHSKLELELTDKRERSANNNTEKLSEELLRIEREISEKNEELLVVCNDYDTTKREEFEINARLMLDEQRRQQLFTKLGREALFSSIQERNHWIKDEQCKLNRLILQEEEELRNITEDMKDEELKAKTLETVIAGIEDEKLAALNSVKILNQRKQDLLLEQRRLRMSRNELWRKECDVRDHWKQSYDKLERLKCQLRSAMFSQTQVLEGIAMILDNMKREGQGTLAFDMASQYRGLLIDQFTCADEVCCAIDAVGGNRLFYSITDTDEAASEILKWINKEPYKNGFGLPGSFNFYARNRLKRTPPIGPIRNQDDVMPMMTIVNCAPEMTPVVEQIFGRVLVCRDFDVALRTAKTYDIDCVTLEGDTVRRNGVLNGGYRNIAHSGSKIYFELKQTREVEQTELAYLHEVEIEIQVADYKCNENASELQKIETKLSQTKVELLEEDLKKQRSTLSLSRQALEGKLAITRKLMMSVEANRAKIEMLEDELEKDFETELGSEERSEVDKLNERIQSDKINLKNVNATRLKLEGMKNSLESQLNDHLMRTKQNLERIIREKNDCGPYGAEVNKQAIKDMDEHLKKLESRMKENSKEIGIIEDRIAELSKAVDESKNELDGAKNRRHEQQIELDRRHDAINRILESIKRKEAALKVVISTLGTLGTFREENEKKVMNIYAEYNVKKLERELILVKDELKRFEGVNQKAPLDYAFTAEKLEDLKEQMVRLKNGHRQCIELIKNVDSTKNNAIQYSLMQVARSFRRMFKTLVPSPGIGHLKWTCDGQESDSDSENEGEPQIPDVDRITGVAVKVSFSNTTSIQDFNSLSGGQKSVVSMALIFAILMMDRAPFYLLDEADMALDASYRSKVADMVGKFSQKSQFIAITFRPELLEHADNIIGVFFDAATQISRITSITREEAHDFISNHGSESTDSSCSPSSGASLQ